MRYSRHLLRDLGGSRPLGKAALQGNIPKSLTHPKSRSKLYGQICYASWGVSPLLLLSDRLVKLQLLPRFPLPNLPNDMYATKATPARRLNRPPAPAPSTAPSKAQLQSLRRTTRRQALVQRKQQQRLAELKRETLIKLSVNGVLIAVSVAALAKLVPSLWTQQSQLKEIRSELISTQTRVGHLRSDFNRTFDPMQGSAVMQQQSYRTDPNQKPVVWVKPGTSSGIQQPQD